MTKINEETELQIIKKYREGIKVKDLVIEFNVSQLTINRYLLKNNIGKYKYNSTRKFSDEKEKLIINIYKQGKTTKEIALMFNTFNTSIRRVLLINNIKIRTNKYINRLCKHNPFKRNDEYSEYFLGLLLTDGCITKEKQSSRNYGINLSLSEIDSYMIENFRNWASPNSKITKIHQKLNNSYMYSVTIRNEEAEGWLRRKGNFTNKSYYCKIYTPITWNILRGIFDGDGGFSCNNKDLDFFICGASKVFIEQISNFLVKNGIYATIREDKRANSILYYVYVYRKNNVIKLGELMYNNAYIYLKRKYDKWLAFYESKKAKDLNSGKEMAIQP